MQNASGPSASLLEGMVVLWASEHVCCNLLTWCRGKRLTDKRATAQELVLAIRRRLRPARCGKLGGLFFAILFARWWLWRSRILPTTWNEQREQC